MPQAICSIEGERAVQLAATPAAARPLIVIAAGVEDAAMLLAGLVLGARGRRLDRCAGVAGVAAVLDGPPGTTELRLVASGAPGRLMLGDAEASLATLAADETAWLAIGAALAPGAVLHLWACGVAEGAAGRQFIEGVAEATGLAVAA